MPKFEHEESKTVFTLPDEPWLTVRDQLKYSRSVTGAGDEAFVAAWKFIGKLVKNTKGVEWTSDVCAIDIDIDTPQSIEVRDVIIWAITEFAGFMNALSVPSPNSSAPQ